MPTRRGVSPSLGFFVLTLFLVSSSTLFGQATTLGNIVGTVLDSSGAAIPAAPVRVVNMDTGITREVVTDTNGYFSALSLVAGNYRVEVSAPNFQRQIQENIKLDVASSVSLNFRLAVGQVTETVSVAAEAELLKSSDATMGTTITNTVVLEMPLNGRNFNNLVRLTPGATRGTNGTGNTLNAQTWAVTGSRSDNANYTLDGMFNNGTFFKTAAIAPSIDAIQEFKVSTNMSAQYGAAAGANINVAIRGGSNNIRGTVYHFLRNNVLDSRDYFAAARRPFRLNQFGFTLGGPVLIPKIYNGKNKSFWFFNYEGFQERRGETQVQTLPDAAMRRGDFRSQLNGQPGPAIFDPATERANPNGSGFIRSPFPGNQIPANRIQRYATAYFDFWFPTNLTPGVNTGNFINSTSRAREDNQIHTRFDQKIGEKNNLFGRFSWSDIYRNNPANLPKAFIGTYNKYVGFTVNDTHIFNPSTILNFRGGYLRSNLGEGPTSRFITLYQQNGLSNIPSNFRQFDFPINFGIAGFSAPNLGNLVNGPDFTYQGSLSLNKIIGKHNLIFGFDYTRLRVFHDSVFSTFNFNNLPTADPQAVAATGQPVASFLLGLPSTANRIAGQADLDIRQVLYHGFIQDDIRVTPKLTINLGLRYEYNEWPHHIRGRIGGFDTTRGQFYWTGTNPITGAPPNAPKTIAAPQKRNFAPRIGFAYRIGPRTVIRSAYGIFYNANLSWEWSTGRGNPPYAISDNLTGLNIPGASPLRADQLFLSFDPRTASQQAQHTIGRDLQMPYMQNWNFGIEHQIARDLVLEMNYQGSKGTHLSSFLSTNDPTPGPGDPNIRRPYPQAGSLSDLKMIATSRYNALTARLEKRYSNGLNLLAVYAWQKNIDLNSEFGGTSPQNNLNNRLDLAPSGFDQTHVFNASFVYELPFFKNSRGFLKQALGGWQTNGIVTLETGRPFNITVPFDNANVGARGNFQRPNLVGNPFPNGWNRVPGPAGQWFDPSAFRVAAPFSFGNLGRNVLRGPAFRNVDFGLYKNFPIHEQVRLQFRWESFNLLNNTNFGNPGGGITTPNFGRITGTATLQRAMQFALKLYF